MEIQSDNLLYGHENKESVCLVSFMWFVVYKIAWPKKIPQETARCVSKNRNCFDKCTLGDKTLAYSGAKVQSRFYPGDLVTHAGDQETPGLSRRVGMYAV